MKTTKQRRYMLTITTQLPIRLRLCTLTLLAILFNTSNINAQYFHHIYGSASPVANEYCNSGAKIRSYAQPSQLEGHIMTGYRHDPSTGYDNVYYVYTDIDGNAITNVEIPLYSGATQLDAVATDIVELKYGVGITGYVTQPAIVGPPSIPAHEDVFFIYMNFTETTINAYVYDGVGGGGTQIDERGLAIIRSEDIDEQDDEYLVFITGYSNPGSNKDAIALGLHYDGTMIWGKKYYFGSSNTFNEVGNDIAMLTPSSQDEIAIVGNYKNNGLFFRVSQLTGASVGNAIVYTGVPDLELSSVKYVVTDNSYSAGTIIGGTTDYGGDKDFVMIRTDLTGSQHWFKYYDSGFGDDICQDVMPLLKTIGGSPPHPQEFYAVGETNNAISGTSDKDIFVVKTDAIGTPSNYFFYGYEDDDYASAIDIVPYAHSAVATNPGMGIYATTISYDINSGTPGTSLFDFYLVNAYLNGITECNYEYGEPNEEETDGETEYTPHDDDRFYKTDLGISDNTYTELAICHADNVNDGSNSFIGRNTSLINLKASSKRTVYPTQIPAENNVTVSYNLSNSIHAIDCFDNTGRRIEIDIQYNNKEGQLQIVFNTNLSCGIYYLKIDNKVFKLVK